MKRYLTFAGSCFYARGGFNDLAGEADSVAEAKIAALALMEEDHGSESVDWWQIVDIQTGAVVEASEATPLGGDLHHAAPYHMQFLSGYFVPQVVEMPDDAL
jgi:hypothetical protein